MQKNTDNRTGLFTYLLLRVLPVAALLMAITSYIGLHVTRDIALNKANELLLTQNEQTERIVQQRIDNILSQTRGLTRNALLVNGLIDVEGRNDYLPKFFQSLRLAGYDNTRIEMTDYKGRLVFANPIRVTSDEATRLWRSETIQDGKASSRLSWRGFVAIEPILYSGHPEGAVIVSLGREGLFGLFDTGTQYNETLVTDGDAKIIYSSSSELGVAGETLSPSVTGGWLTASNDLIGYPGVKLLTLQRKDVAFASQQWLENFVIAGALVALLILLTAIALTAYLTKRDVSGLSDVVKQITSTEDITRRIVPTGPAELHALGVEFNRMMDTLQRTTTSYEYVDSIISNTNDGIITFDSSGRIETVNLAITKMFGYTPADTIGNDVSLLIQKQHTDEAPQPAFFSAHDGGGTSEIEAERKDGTKVSLELNVAPMQVDGVEKYIGIFRNITQRKRVEKELVDSKRKAEAANLAKSNFLSTMSHEIRTPLNGVLGLAQLLTDTQLDDDQRRKVNTILSSGQILLAIINDVLDMSRIEAGGMELEDKPFALQEIVSTFATPFQSLADDKGLDLRVVDNLPKGLVVVGDPVRLRQILWNLLSNAIKFTDEGHIQLTLNRLDNTPEHVAKLKQYVIHFAIEDTGAGIAPDRLDAIFDAFTQEDSSITRKHGGTGLGLSIVRQITELMGGTIDVESTVDQGTTFNIYLPFDAASQDEVDTISLRAVGQAAHNIGRLKVLLAEDNEVNAVIARSFLEKFGHTVRHVENGKRAVEEASTGWADIVLMDVHMPEMNGLDATKMIRASQFGTSLPIVGLTAEAFRERHKLFTDAGMNAVLTKPFTEQQLETALATHCNIERRRKARKPKPANTEPEAVKAARPGPEIQDEMPVGNREKLEELRQQLGAETMTKLLEEAQTSLTTRLEELNRAVQAEDNELIRETAHAIKGSSSSLFALRVADLAKTMEENMAETDTVRGLMPQFETAARQTIEWWKEEALTN